MKLIEIRHYDKTKGSYVRMLLHRGLITRYITKSGHVAIDKAELAGYIRTARVGRPRKTSIKEKEKTSE